MTDPIGNHRRDPGFVKSGCSPQSDSATRRPSKRLAALAMVLLALIWGYNWVIMKVSLQYVGPFEFSALRVTLGSLSLFALMAILRRPFRPKALKATALLGLMQTSGFVCLAIWALVYGGAGKTAVLIYTMPFWVLLLSWPILGEKVRGTQWIAVGSALAGLLLILNPLDMRGTLTGNLLAVGGGFSWAVSTVFAKRMERSWNLDLLSLTAWQMLLGSIPILIITFLTPRAPIQWTAPFISALVFNVLFANALGWFLWLFIVRAFTANTAGLASLVTPVVGVVSASIQLGERPAPAEAAGMGLVIAAIAVLSFRGYFASRRQNR